MDQLAGCNDYTKAALNEGCLDRTALKEEATLLQGCLEFVSELLLYLQLLEHLLTGRDSKLAGGCLSLEHLDDPILNKHRVPRVERVHHQNDRMMYFFQGFLNGTVLDNTPRSEVSLHRHLIMCAHARTHTHTHTHTYIHTYTHTHAHTHTNAGLMDAIVRKECGKIQMSFQGEGRRG